MEISLHSGEKLLGNLKEWSDLVLSTARKNGICVDDKGSLATPPLCFILQWVHTVFIVFKKLCFVKFTMDHIFCWWNCFFVIEAYFIFFYSMNSIVVQEIQKPLLSLYWIIWKLTFLIYGKVCASLLFCYPEIWELILSLDGTFRVFFFLRQIKAFI